MTECAECAVIATAVVDSDLGWLDLSHFTDHRRVVCPACADRIDAECEEDEGD
jgi:hypothetical protein